MLYLSRLCYGLLLLALMNCSSSHITSSWKKPGLTVKKYSRVLVIGVMRETDMPVRERMETHLVGDLKDLGYNAYSSFTEYGPEGFYKMDSQSVYKKLRADHVDAVLTIVLLDKRKEILNINKAPHQTTYSISPDHMWTYYNRIQGVVESDKYYDESTSYFWESRFYDLELKQLIYSVQTRSFDPSSANALGHEYGQLIINKMVQDKVLTREAKENIIE